LLWFKEWGEHLENLTNLAEAGKNVKVLENRPILLQGLGFYLNAYDQLQYDRPVGMSVGAIPWSSVINWCKLHRIYDINEIEIVLKYIRALENADRKFEESKKNDY